MDSNQAEVAFEFLPNLRIYKDGRVERLRGTEVVPPSLDIQTGVSSKDVVIIPEMGVFARLYLPKIIDPLRKLPLVIYFHGGRFCVYSAFSPMYHQHLNSLASQANVIVVSVDYRRAPEHPLPTAYDDSWAALQWVASHSNGKGHETWLHNHVDFTQVCLAGDSAGGNIVHNMAMRVVREEIPGLKLARVALIHPYFWGEESIGSEGVDLDKKADIDRVWPYICPSSPSHDDPRVNPFVVGAPSLSSLGCTRVLVCVAEKDILRDRGWLYYETLRKSGWGGEVQITETEGEGHVFHLFNPTCEKAFVLVKRLASFLGDLN